VNWRLVGGALVVVALAAGLAVALSVDGGERATPPPTDAVKTAVHAPTTDALLPTTTTPVVPESIWLDLLATHNRSFQHPGEADLTDYLSADCPCLPPLQERIDFLVANGWYEDDAGVAFDSLDVIAQSANSISLLVRDRHVELRVVDAAGTVVERAPARPLTEWRVDLARDPNGWRITRWDLARSP
jgi:hypothetical protein